LLEANAEPAPNEPEPGFAEAVMIEDGAAASSSAVRVSSTWRAALIRAVSDRLESSGIHKGLKF